MSKIQKQEPGSSVREKKVKRSKSQSETPNSTSSQYTTSNAHTPVVNVANTDSFLLEEEEAQKRDADKDYLLFRNACDEIRQHMKDILNLKKNENSEQEVNEHRVQVYMLFLLMKKLNRLDKHRCKKARDAVNEVKQKVDNFHLQLQNLLYEVMHLKKEVTKCLEFRSKDEEIDLVSEKEFYKQAPVEISRPEITKNDPHRLTLARLEWELEQRKRLAEKLKEMEQMKNVYQKEIEKRKECLDNIQPILKSILEATQPLHAELGMPLQATQLQHKVAEFLPRPLYVLYVQMCAYREACASNKGPSKKKTEEKNEDQKLHIEIEGNSEEAKTLHTESEFADDDSADSDQEELTTARHRRSTCDKKEENILSKHPLSVCLTVESSGDGKMCVQFFYLNHLHIITCSVKLISPQPSYGISASDLLKPDSLLSCLFPGDTGKESPNPANRYQLKKNGIEESPFLGYQYGHPYQWAQQLAGLEFLSVDDIDIPNSGMKKQHSVSASCMERTITALRSRLTARVMLFHQLLSLENGYIYSSSQISSLFPAKVIAHLTEWRKITFQDFQSHPSCSELQELGLVSEEDAFFKAVLERGSAKLSSLIALPPAYPVTPPIFLLILHWKANRTSATDGAVWELEQEVNLHCVELLPISMKNHLLSCQLHHLLVGFDVCLETETSGDTIEGPREFSQGKVFTMPARGRNRSRPYKYLAKLGIFTQR